MNTALRMATTTRDSLFGMGLGAAGGGVAGASYALGT